jgi:hypothetical protein
MSFAFSLMLNLASFHLKAFNLPKAMSITQTVESAARMNPEAIQDVFRRQS